MSYGLVEIQLQVFLTSTLDWDEYYASLPFIPVIQCTGGWMDSEPTGFCDEGVPLCRTAGIEIWFYSLYSSNYTELAITAPLIIWKRKT
jgi:hypothetical protein